MLVRISGILGTAAAAASAEKLVVVPDVHGDIDTFKEALALGEVDGPEAGDTTLVSLGDLVDRGPRAPECYELLANYSTAAHSGADGSLKRVVRLLGNHDWINMNGVGPRSAFAQYVHDDELHELGGWDNRRSLFGAAGSVGSALRRDFRIIAQVPAAGSPCDCSKSQLPALNQASTLMVHAGVRISTARSYGSPGTGDAADAIAAQALDEALAEKTGRSKLYHELLQDRFFARGAESRICDELTEVLCHFCAARLVLGHTPPDDGYDARVRCGGRLVLLDVAQSRWIDSMSRPAARGQPAILEMRHNGTVAESLAVVYGGDNPRRVDIPLVEALEEEHRSPHESEL